MDTNISGIATKYPFLASLIGDTVNWSWFDYTVMGILSARSKYG